MNNKITLIFNKKFKNYKNKTTVDQLINNICVTKFDNSSQVSFFVFFSKFSCRTG